MGNNDSKLSTYRAAINELTGRQGPAPADDEAFWSQFWHDNHIEAVGDVFTVLTAAEIRALRDHHPENLATLCYKAVEQLVRVTDTLCNTVQQQKTVLSCVALLTRLLPYVFEEADWRASFFWSTLPSPSASLSSLDDAAAIGGGGGSGSGFHGASFYRKHYQQQSRHHHSSHQMDLLANMPLAQSLLLALADLLFCPDFTVAPLDSTGSSGKDSKGSNSRFGVPDSPPDDLQSIDSCEYIWEAGVGCSMSSPSSAQYDHNRTALLRLLLTCFSESMYCSTAEVGRTPNAWIDFFSSAENRHALPLFTSLLNTVFAYNPNGGLLPFNHLLFSDSKEPLVEVALQLLIVILDHDFSSKQTTTAAPPLNQERPDPDELQDTRTTMAYHTTTMNTSSSPPLSICSEQQSPLHLNLFINYLSRIHREDDFEFLLRGFTRLLNNPLAQSYLPNSNKRIAFHQELLVLFWKLCDYNKKFMHYVLKTCDVLQILVPILYHLNDARADRSRVGLVHIGVFILLLLSGERNFGVRLNRPYLATAPMDLPIFSGTHADLLVVVFHKLITTGHTRLQPLFDCLLTILVNVSPYLKTLSMVAAAKVLHLLEAFSTPWFLFSNPSNHHLVFFLLEIFNNIIQYQFDGNANLMYTIIKKRHAFHALANLPTDYGAIQRSLSSATNAASASSASSASAGSLRRSSSSRVAGGHSRKHQPHRPHSLIERASSQPPEQYPYAHSQYMVGNGKGSGGKSAPTSPHTDYPPDTAAMIDESSGRNLEKPPSQATIDGGGPLEGHSRSIGLGEQNTNTMAAGAASEAEMNVTLAAVPKIDSMTERMHPNTGKTEEEEEEGDEGPQYEPEFEYRGDMVTPLSDIVRREGAMARKSQSISRQSSTASERTSVSTSTRNQQHQQQQAPMPWAPTSEWIQGWKQKLPLQTIMRMLQVLVPQVEKMCIEKGITDENEILRFLQHGTLVGLLPVPHPILIRKYQTNVGTTIWFRTYMWGVIYLRNSDPPIWYDTNVRLFEIQKN